MKHKLIVLAIMGANFASFLMMTLLVATTLKDRPLNAILMFLNGVAVVWCLYRWRTLHE